MWNLEDTVFMKHPSFFKFLSEGQMSIYLGFKASCLKGKYYPIWQNKHLCKLEWRHFALSCWLFCNAPSSIVKTKQETANLERNQSGGLDKWGQGELKGRRNYFWLLKDTELLCYMKKSFLLPNKHETSILCYSRFLPASNTPWGPEKGHNINIWGQLLRPLSYIVL